MPSALSCVQSSLRRRRRGNRAEHNWCVYDAANERGFVADIVFETCWVEEMMVKSGCQCQSVCSSLSQDFVRARVPRNTRSRTRLWACGMHWIVKDNGSGFVQRLPLWNTTPGWSFCPVTELIEWNRLCISRSSVSQGSGIISFPLTWYLISTCLYQSIILLSYSYMVYNLYSLATKSLNEQHNILVIRSIVWVPPVLGAKPPNFCVQDSVLISTQLRLWFGTCSLASRLKSSRQRWHADFKASPKWVIGLALGSRPIFNNRMFIDGYHASV